MRQKVFTSLRRAKLRPDDALHLLENGFTVTIPDVGTDQTRSTAGPPISEV